jgi:hypothetical protein
MTDTGERFGLRGDAMHGMARRLNARFALTVATVALLVVGLFSAGLRGREGGHASLAVGLGVLAVLAFWSWRRRITRFRARWASYTVVLGPDAVERTVEGYPDVRIARADVAAVGDTPGGLVVRGRSGEAVAVPRELQGYERLREALLGWRPAG